MQSISGVLNGIHNTWRSHGQTLMQHPSASYGMWPHVQGILSSTMVTMEGMKHELRPILGSGGGSLFGASSKAWKMGMRVRTLTNYRGRVQTHQAGLKLSATMMMM